MGLVSKSFYQGFPLYSLYDDDELKNADGFFHLGASDWNGDEWKNEIKDNKDSKTITFDRNYDTEKLMFFVTDIQKEELDTINVSLNGKVSYSFIGEVEDIHLDILEEMVNLSYIYHLEIVEEEQSKVDVLKNKLFEDFKQKIRIGKMNRIIDN